MNSADDVRYQEARTAEDGRGLPSPVRKSTPKTKERAIEMRLVRIFTVCAVALSCGGCGFAAQVVVSAVEEITAPPSAGSRDPYAPRWIEPEFTKKLEQAIPVSVAGTPLSESAEHVGHTSVISCGGIFDDEGTQYAAVARLRLRAHRAGANAVEQVVCDAPEGASKHCSRSVNCQGALVRRTLPNGVRERRADLGTFGVAVLEHPATVKVKGWSGSGASTGGTAGALTGAGAGLLLCAGAGPFAVIFCPPLVLMGSLAGGGAGALAGYHAEVARDQQEVIQRIGQELHTDSAVEEQVRRRVEARLAERFDNVIGELPRTAWVDQKSTGSWEPLRARSIDTVVEIRLQDLHLQSLPSNALVVVARSRIRVVRATDGRIMHDVIHEYEDERHVPLSETASRLEILQSALDRAHRGLAEQVATAVAMGAVTPEKPGSLR